MTLLMPEHCIPLHVCEHVHKMQSVGTQGAKKLLVPCMRRNRSSIIILAIVSLLLSLLAYVAGACMAWKDAVSAYVHCLEGARTHGVECLGAGHMLFGNSFHLRDVWHVSQACKQQYWYDSRFGRLAVCATARFSIGHASLAGY